MLEYNKSGWFYNPPYTSKTIELKSDDISSYFAQQNNNTTNDGKKDTKLKRFTNETINY